MNSDTNKPGLFEGIAKTSDAFRLGVLNQANELFVALVDQMAEVFPLLDKQEQILKANNIIASILSAHQRGDYIGLADDLEYQLKPFLEAIEYESKG